MDQRVVTALQSGGIDREDAMLTIQPNDGPLGATITGVDLGANPSDADFTRILQALGRYGVLRFPDQHFERDALLRLSLFSCALPLVSEEGPSSHRLAAKISMIVRINDPLTD